MFFCVFVLKLWAVAVTFINVCTAQPDPNSQWDPNLTPLKLYGPDEFGLLECITPGPFPVDTHVEWYVNSKNLRSQLLPKGENHLFESMTDIIALLGNYPGTVQCKLTDKAVVEKNLGAISSSGFKRGHSSAQKMRASDLQVQLLMK